MATAFTGFLAGDFDAYTSEKWSSNMFNRQRLEVKQRAVVLGKELAAFLATLDLPLALGASDEHPSLWNKKRVDCQWLFFSRDEEQRRSLEAIVDRDKKLSATLLDPTPFSRHAFLTLRLDHEGMELAFKLHRNAWVDVKNLQIKMDTTAGAAQMMRLLADLPAGFDFGAGDRRLGASEATAESLAPAVAELSQGAAEWFFVGAKMGRDQAIELGTALTEAVSDAFRLLAPIYRCVAWSRENDFVSIDRELAQEAAERLAAHERLTTEERERDERLARERDLARQRARDMGPGGATPWLPPRPTRPAADAAPSRPSTPPEPPRAAPPAPRVAAPAPRPAPSTRPSAPAARPVPARREEPARPAPAPRPAARPAPPVPTIVDKGVRVRIGKGPFAGKVGTVQEIEKGVAKVLLGLLAARVDVQDLVPVGGEPTRRS